MCLPKDSISSVTELQYGHEDQASGQVPRLKTSGNRDRVVSFESVSSESGLGAVEPPSVGLGENPVSELNQDQAAGPSAPPSLRGRARMSNTAKGAAGGAVAGGVVGVAGTGIVGGLAGAGVVAGGAATMGKFLIGGMGIGAVIGGPIGAAVGAAVGVVVGALVVGAVGALVGAIAGKLKGTKLPPMELAGKYSPDGAGFNKLAKQANINPDTDLSAGDKEFIRENLKQIQGDALKRRGEASLRSYTKKLMQNLAAARAFAPPDSDRFKAAANSVDVDPAELTPADLRFTEELLQQRSRDYAADGRLLEDDQLQTLCQGLATGLARTSVDELLDSDRKNVANQLRETLGAGIAVGRPMSHQRVATLVQSLVGGMRDMRAGIAARLSEAKTAAERASDLGQPGVEAALDLPDEATTDATVSALGRFLPAENLTKTAHRRAEAAAQQAVNRLLDPNTTSDQMAEALTNLIQRSGQYTTARFQALNGIRAGIGKGNKEYGNAEFEEDTNKLLEEALEEANVPQEDAAGAYRRLMGPDGLARRFRFAGPLVLADHRLADNENVGNVGPKLMRSFGDSMLALADRAGVDKQQCVRGDAGPGRRRSELHRPEPTRSHRGAARVVRERAQHGRPPPEVPGDNGRHRTKDTSDQRTSTHRADSRVQAGEGVPVQVRSKRAAAEHSAAGAGE